jgi:hypothetical protein
MEKVLLFAICVTILFGIMKALEMKFIEKDMKPMKLIVRDLIIAFCSSFLSATIFLQYSSYLDDFISIITNTKMINTEKTKIFTDFPDF